MKDLDRLLEMSHRSCHNQPCHRASSQSREAGPFQIHCANHHRACSVIAGRARGQRKDPGRRTKSRACTELSAGSLRRPHRHQSHQPALVYPPRQRNRSYRLDDAPARDRDVRPRRSPRPAACTRSIAHLPIRSRGTIGGSLSHADRRQSIRRSRWRWTPSSSSHMRRDSAAFRHAILSSAPSKRHSGRTSCSPRSGSPRGGRTKASRLRKSAAGEEISRSLALRRRCHARMAVSATLALPSSASATDRPSRMMRHAL